MTTAKANTVLMAQADVERLEARLRNWCEWLYASDPSLRSGGCASMERRYRAPRPDSEALLAGVQRSMIDHVDGELLDRAIVGLPNIGRVYLQMAYVKNRTANQMATRLKIDIARFDELHQRVLCMLASKLAELERPMLIRRGKKLWAGLTAADPLC